VLGLELLELPRLLLRKTPANEARSAGATGATATMATPGVVVAATVLATIFPSATMATAGGVVAVTASTTIFPGGSGATGTIAGSAKTA